MSEQQWNPRFKMSNRMLHMIARAARVMGKQPYVYVPDGRDYPVIYVDGAYWNPLEATRMDHMDILASVGYHISYHTLTESAAVDYAQYIIECDRVRVTATLWSGNHRHTVTQDGERADVRYLICLATTQAAALLDEAMRPHQAINLPD